MNINLNRILRHPATIPTAIGVLSFGGGVVVGIFLGARATWKEAQEILQEQVDKEVEEIKDRRVIIDEEDLKDRPTPKPEVTVEEHIRRKLSNNAVSVVSEEPTVVSANVFAQSDDDWDHEEEKKKRSSDTPYILHKDEFHAREMPGFMQKTFTYWLGDDTLSDEQVPPVAIYNRDQIVGNDNLRFGHGSGEEHVVYIRNETRREEYEILLEEGMYAVEVAGFALERDSIEHSDVPKFRKQE
jgi:hypothetical protein